MHLFSLFITLLLLSLLIALTAASSKNPVKATTRLSIDCGSAATSVALNSREWIGDIQPKGSSMLQIKGPSTASISIRSSTSADQVPHSTARMSPSRFSYAFRVTPGEKILRLHFNPALYKGFTKFYDLFNVEAGPFTLLSNFSASLTAAALGVTTFTKEYCINIEENQTLNIAFSAVTSQLGYTYTSTYAFINGIEIIPVPLRLSYFKGGDHRAQVVGEKAIIYIDNSTALELTHRVKIKQDSVSLSDEFDDEAKENEINSLAWKRPVDVGFRYLVRIHFCDLRLHGMSLKVYVDERIVDAYITIQQDEYGIVQYRDYAVVVKGRKEEGKRDLSISLQSFDKFVDRDQLVKGFEIFKLSNPDNSLSSPNEFSPRGDSPPWIINNIVPILSRANATATLGIVILALINIIIHKVREIYEASSITEDENIPSAKAERLCRRFSLSELQSATKNFSGALLIGKGGFGNVYKGIIDNGRETVAVKRLKPNSTQGKHEFLTEIETLSELQHINLVSLIGYCCDHKEMILVYEYMPRGTLADHLHKYTNEGHGCSLTWKERLNICIGSARGLDYLHTGNRVIHRDVKASNILLDENLLAKVSDFGLAKPEDRSKLQSHMSTKVKGTYGYLDPYYHSTRKLTRKSDTYAFGVVLLETLCERQALDSRFGEEDYCLTRWAQKRINDGQVNQIVASSLLEEIIPESLKVYVEVAERCLHGEPNKRPTMGQIVVQLESALEQQEIGKTMEPIAGIPAEPSTNVHADTSPPTKQINSNYFPDEADDMREPKPYKPRFWALDAFWNRLKPSKTKELSLTSEFCEADIRLPKFHYSRVVAATNQFSSSYKIGSLVYKAVLPTGRMVAIKIYREWRDFKNEILSVSSLHHRNIIKLLGFCIHDKTGMLLFEFMENGGLDKFIFDEQRRSQLQWPARFKVIIGIAKGVIYLHLETRPKTIHRDLKPSNVLLDKEMNPKISGFYIARSTEDDRSELPTSHVAGTMGYLSPEILHTGKSSEMTDVYSFGVVVLEILSGKRVIQPDPEFLIDYAWKLWREEERNVMDLVDESLGGEFSEEEALRCIQVGLLCTQYVPQQRPTMASALKILLGEELPLQEKMAQAQAQAEPPYWATNWTNYDSFNLMTETEFHSRF